ncbi:mechanosensitive ion channel [Neolewinella lacunae]|uniref:Mechanosensitive ion channel n=1 Tax=Neolewinella lacunae TaxID=1517758 RepID=A0A923PRK2_9BACT|nr:mechanosensitive ion channel domain-containing protein [Neolewinella lacunae]MBC6996168.1 mechanosensitive ion channel [Neolewinella lacunae]MDN3634019.1 mechanosensitive ion channel [Neolewinella lacunae]
MESIIQVLKLQALQLLEIIPALIKAVVIFLVGWILAKALARIVRGILQAIGIDRLAERLMSIDLLSKANIRLVPSAIVGGIVYYFTLIVFIMAAVEALGMRMISDLMVDLIEYIPSAITAFILLLVGLFLADAIKKILVTTCRSLGITSGNLIANVVFYFILLNVVLLALRQAKLQTEFMEDNISILLAGIAGAFAIGYGLASRHLMGSILASFYSRGRIKVGDEISIDGMRGEVVTINNHDLILRAEDSEFVVPFSKLSTAGVEIHSRREVGPALPPHEGGK